MRAVLTCGRAPGGRGRSRGRAWAAARHAAVAAGLITGSVAVAAEDCADDAAQQVVLLEATVTSDGAPAPKTVERSGIVVSDTGLVLTVYSLIEGVKPNDLLGQGPGAAAHQITITLPGKRLKDSSHAVNATVIGFDWRRDILLLKIPALSQIDSDIKAAELSRKSIDAVKEVCFVGYARKGSARLAPHANARAEIRQTDDIHWVSEQEASGDEALGGAVLDMADHALVGMIGPAAGGATRFLPIEYADTLLSQLFIARITRDLGNVRDVAEQVKTGLSWGFQILENTTGKLDIRKFNSLRIRFFFTQHVDELEKRPISVGQVIVKTVLQGEKGDEILSVDIKRPERIETVSQGKTYFDYDAADYIKDAEDLGFTSLTDIKLSIRPVFQVGREPIETDRKQTFEISLQTVGQ